MARHWRWLALFAFLVLNSVLIVARIRPGEERIDWRLFETLPSLLSTGNLYAPVDAGRWVWSPVAAYLMVGVTWLGYWPWLAVHVAALTLLRDWRLMGLAIASWPFWVDAQQGHHLVFVAVAGVLAMRGSRPAALVYVALFLLAPRPLEVPLLAWLLWRDRRLWKPAAILFGVHAVAVLASGYTFDWAASMGQQLAHGWNLGPGYFLGLWWLLIGVPLAVWLTRRGWVGTAGWAMSHYVLPQYFLLLLVDADRYLRRLSEEVHQRDRVTRPGLRLRPAPVDPNLVAQGGERL